MLKLSNSFSKKTFFISALAVLLFIAIVFTYFQSQPVAECGQHKLFQSCVYIDRNPEVPISYNSNCNIPSIGDTKAQVRANMTATYACAVQNTLSKYKDKPVSLESPKAQADLASSLFGTSQLETNLLVYEASNWKIYFWSPKPDQKFQTENYQIHPDNHYHSQESPGKKANKTEISVDNKVTIDAAVKMAPTQEIIMAQPELVIKVNNQYESLNYKHILKITGFETETQMIDFVLIHNKLFGQNQKLHRRKTDTEIDSTIRRHTPLLFLQDYQFTNKSDEGLKFSCSQEFSSNLKTQVNLNQKEIQYFTHENQHSLSKITLKIEADKLQYKIEELIDCGAMINC